MKRTLAIILSSVLMLACLTACKKTETSTETTSEESKLVSTETTEETTEQASEETTAETTEESTADSSEESTVAVVDAILGSWTAAEDGYSMTLTFFEDGKGYYVMSFGGETIFYDSTYKADEDTVKILVDGEDMLEFTYEFEEDKLMLTMEGESMAFSACDTPERPSESSEEIEYTEYDNGYITFNYPASYAESEVGGVILLQDAATGDNITVASEPVSDLYDDLTAEKFEALFKDSFASAGMTISEVYAGTYENSVGTEMIYVDYYMEMTGVEMIQYMLIVEAGDKFQIVTLTQVGDIAPEAFSEVMDSVKVVK